MYVLEYLLGMYCASDDPTVIEQGMRNVKTMDAGLFHEKWGGLAAAMAAKSEAVARAAAGQ